MAALKNNAKLDIQRYFPVDYLKTAYESITTSHKLSLFSETCSRWDAQCEHLLKCSFMERHLFPRTQGVAIFGSKNHIVSLCIF